MTNDPTAPKGGTLVILRLELIAGRLQRLAHDVQGLNWQHTPESREKRTQIAWGLRQVLHQFEHEPEFPVDRRCPSCGGSHWVLVNPEGEEAYPVVSWADGTLTVRDALVGEGDPDLAYLRCVKHPQCPTTYHVPEGIKPVYS